ncbi:MAG: sigma-70 family RNA polymerase sigma factor [Anaerolineae bacterium]|nr:sigma-70 family RNA polymerase sigma factor [Anaerolineae bacterium]
MTDTGEAAANRARLKQFIETEHERLLRTLRLYVARAGLETADDAVTTIAAELLNDVVVEALSHADRFDPARRPMAWLLGIAANLVKRRQAELRKHKWREPLARDLGTGSEAETLSDDEIFDRLPQLFEADPAQSVEENENIHALLAHVSPGDQRVLRLAVLNDLDGEMLARELGLLPGAARVRLHRALNRLRDAIQTQGLVQDHG